MAYLFTITMLAMIFTGVLQANIYLGMKIRKESRFRKEQRKLNDSIKENKKPKVEKISKKIEEYNAGRKGKNHDN